MVAIDILKFPTSSPGDTTPLQLLRNAGYDADQILAVIGKTEGKKSVDGCGPTLTMARKWLCERLQQDISIDGMGATDPERSRDHILWRHRRRVVSACDIHSSMRG